VLKIFEVYKIHLLAPEKIFLSFHKDCQKKRLPVGTKTRKIQPSQKLLHQPTTSAPAEMNQNKKGLFAL